MKRSLLGLLGLAGALLAVSPWIGTSSPGSQLSPPPGRAEDPRATADQLRRSAPQEGPHPGLPAVSSQNPQQFGRFHPLNGLQERHVPAQPNPSSPHSAHPHSGQSGQLSGQPSLGARGVGPSRGGGGLSSPGRTQEENVFLPSVRTPVTASEAQGMIVSVTPVGSTHQQVIVIDSEHATMAVYEVNLVDGQVRLRSVRHLRWDLQLTGFNTHDPQPNEIRENLRRNRP